MKDYLKDYTPREKFNIYAGTALAPVIGTMVMYAGIFNIEAFEPEYLGLKIVGAALANLPFVLHEMAGGLAVGFLSADQLHEKEKKEPTNPSIDALVVNV